MSPITLDEARGLIRGLLPDARRVGWQLGLTGSVLTEGQSTNDLDLIAFPRQVGPETSIQPLHDLLVQHGWRLVMTAQEVKAKWWRNHESIDQKHVEKWRVGEWRVDLFVLR